MNNMQNKITRTKVINLYGGPGTGKSTTAAGLFSALKLLGVNAELVQEYAKDKAWEFGTNHLGVPKVLQCQEYIFGKQHYRMRRLVPDVDIIITDSPLLMGLVYMPDDFPMPSLRKVVKEAYDMYENLDIFLLRVKPYNTSGRFQTEDEARVLDGSIKQLLREEKVPCLCVDAGKDAASDIIEYLYELGWIDACQIKNRYKRELEMSVLDKIKTASVTARKDKKIVTANLLTTLLSEVQNVGKNDGNRQTTDGEAAAVIKKFLNGIAETLKYLPPDDVRFQTATLEKEILEGFLPRQYTEDELRNIIAEIVEKMPVKSQKHMGDVMKQLRAEHDGLFDGSTASKLVKASFI